MVEFECWPKHRRAYAFGVGGTGLCSMSPSDNHRGVIVGSISVHRKHSFAAIRPSFDRTPTVGFRRGGGIRRNRLGLPAGGPQIRTVASRLLAVRPSARMCQFAKNILEDWKEGKIAPNRATGHVGQNTNWGGGHGKLDKPSPWWELPSGQKNRSFHCGSRTKRRRMDVFGSRPGARDGRPDSMELP